MRKIAVLILLCIGVSINMYSNDKLENENVQNPMLEQTCSNEFNWDKVIQAIIHVESRGNAHAVNKSGTCVGVLQIKKILVDDCNQYLKMKKSNKRFSYKDRYSREKSIEMFKLIQERYNKENNIELGIKLWASGLKHNNKQADRYYKKILRLMESF